MNLNKIINQRFSVRKYKTEPVEDDKLELILEAGRMAPSAANYQPWFFIVVRQPDNLKKLHSLYQRDWIKSAPIIIIACADHSQSWKRSSDGKDSAEIDLAIAVDHMTLQATELGLGTCWICNFDVTPCSELFKLPTDIEPVALLPIGYPDVKLPNKKRKPLKEIVRWEEF
ncbi:MAG: nitroreductase [Prolixibacteraceae bacterium]|jgi:nitroreductase|nr:nitroreductase [Prolixibacteraceae bacterium]MBT6005873.1 nitroreductase [Prolixibacteraceae bacterium]MBT6765477.1 nitroreductase [Prolixibacteraceae bacterium]MBT6997685.1 nitroreductase [Prolixibacteraceae bacterium]MBT7395222.1 nitroreductase [Prolixibacteraceae bacterium]